MKFKEIFKNPTFIEQKNDRYWMGTSKIEKDKKFEKGCYSIYHTTCLKGGGKGKSKGKTLFDIPLKKIEDIQEECESEFMMQL
jgi:hypothetical protein